MAPPGDLERQRQLLILSLKLCRRDNCGSMADDLMMAAATMVAREIDESPRPVCRPLTGHVELDRARQAILDLAVTMARRKPEGPS